MAAARAIAAALAAADPANAAAYAANAEAFAAETAALTGDRGAARAGARPAVIVFHDAYQYFEQRFDMPAAGSIALQEA